MLLQHLPDHTAICFSEVYLQKCCQCRALIPERDIFSTRHQLLHCIPTLQKRSDSLPHPADTRGSPSCHVRSLFCCRQLFPFIQKKPSFLCFQHQKAVFVCAHVCCLFPGQNPFDPKILPSFQRLQHFSCTLLHFCIVFYRRMQIDIAASVTVFA